MFIARGSAWRADPLARVTHGWCRPKCTHQHVQLQNIGRPISVCAMWAVACGQSLAPWLIPILMR